ncbi:MAG: STAS domain-containing protein [Syntrophobacteraceae bacterium]
MIKSQVNCPGPGHVVLEFDGRFDRNTAHKVRKDSLKLARKQGPRQLEINLANARCVDTSCIAVMVEILNAVRNQGGRLKLTGIDQYTTRMISLSHLDAIFADVIVLENK